MARQMLRRLAMPSGSEFLSDLSTIDTWGRVLAMAALGGFGGAAHFFTAEPATPGDSWPRSLLVGVVAGLGMLYVDVPQSAPAMIGLAVLAGYFARVVLASLGSRVQLALTKEQQNRTSDAAQAAVQVARGFAAGAPATHPLHVDLARVEARLTDAPRAA